MRCSHSLGKKNNRRRCSYFFHQSWLFFQKKSFLSLLLKLIMRWYVVDMTVTILCFWDFIFRLGFGVFPYFILRLSNLAFRHSICFLYVKLFISYKYHLNQLVSFSLFACLVIKPEIASLVCSLSVPLDEDSILSKGGGSAKNPPILKLAYLFENQ